jgi:glutathione peroxidase
MTLIARRTLLGALLAGTAATAAEEKTAWDFSFPAIEGGTLALAQFRGRVLLVTNTASFCGYTYQYEGLEKLQRDLSPRGLTVVGVPSQDFGQESDSNGKVKAFCEATFSVKFPMAGISHVRDRDAVPFYAWVRSARDWEPNWNFNKVLIGRDGAIKGTFRSGAEPTSPALLQAIDAELARTA